MSTTTAAPEPLDLLDIMRDLEAGRSLPLPPANRIVSLPTRRRPTLGGRAMTATYLTAQVLGRIHPRLARPALERLWFTPWVHPSALRPVRDLPQDAVAWALEVEGRTMRGYAAGRGPTVVLVHGWAGRAADWRHLAGRLVDAGWRVVVPDLPAHGATGGARTDLYELGRAVAAVLEAETPAAVVSHSLGFPMVMRAIEDGASEPAHVIALAPGRRMEHALATFAEQARIRPALARELRGAIERRFGDDVFAAMDVDRVAPSLRSAGLVVHDADDTDVAIEDGRAIAELWPRARFVGTEGLGHRVILRDAAVHDLIVDELAQNVSALV
jgi:pimeloyl-ACP methyl ester carboxylesterase